MFYSTGPGANVIKLFCQWFTDFRAKLECFQHRLEKFTNDKRSSLLWKSVIYGQKKFYNIGPWWDKVGNYFWRENLYSCLASDDNFNFCLQTGWPDWAIFHLLGYFLIGSLKKLPKNGNILGYKFITFSLKKAFKNMFCTLAIFGKAIILASFQKLGKFLPDHLVTLSPNKVGLFSKTFLFVAILDWVYKHITDSVVS